MRTSLDRVGSKSGVWPALRECLQRHGRAAVVGAMLVLPGLVKAREITVAPLGGDFTSVTAGLAAAQSGDRVTVRAGVYYEAVSFSRSGSAAAGFITLQGDVGAILDGNGGSGQGITINSRNYVRVVGMTVRNFRGNGTPMGIDVEGNSSFIELRDNLVHNIESPNGNAHGIAFYGTAATPMTNIVVEGNEIRNCRLGQSEALVLNGNIDGFTVAGNLIHDNDNIGIDFIGFEGTGPAALDQARNGVCVDNRVYNISSATNPTYGGDRSAGGIYVDGGRDIVIERNRIDLCDIGIEVASEHGGKATRNIMVRNNFISRGYLGNILMGGYASNKGDADDIVVVHNTTYQGTSGEIELQHNCDRITIKNNLLVARTGRPYISMSGGNNTNITVDNNVYFGASTTSPGAFPDGHARFTNPLLVGAPADLHLLAGSPAIDAGIDLGDDAQGQPLCGALDIDHMPRVQGSAVNIGAHEFAIVVDAGSGSNLEGGLRCGVAPMIARSSIAIDVHVPSDGSLRVVVYDVRGHAVARIRDGWGSRGSQRMSWDLRDSGGRRVLSGIYFVGCTWKASRTAVKFTVVR